MEPNSNGLTAITMLLIAGIIAYSPKDEIIQTILISWILVSILINSRDIKEWSA